MSKVEYKEKTKRVTRNFKDKLKKIREITKILKIKEKIIITTKFVGLSRINIIHIRLYIFHILISLIKYNSNLGKVVRSIYDLKKIFFNNFWKYIKKKRETHYLNLLG